MIKNNSESADPGAPRPGARLPHRRRSQVHARRRDWAAAEAPRGMPAAVGHQAVTGEDGDGSGTCPVIICLSTRLSNPGGCHSISQKKRSTPSAGRPLHALTTQVA